MNTIYKEAKERQVSQYEMVLKALKLAGDKGLLNRDLNEIMLRYGQKIYELRCDGYQIKTENVGKGLVKYTLLSDKPKKQDEKKSGIEIIREEFDDLDGVFYLFELEKALEAHNLQIIHRPNGLNKNAN